MLTSWNFLLNVLFLDKSGQRAEDDLHIQSEIIGPTIGNIELFPLFCRHHASLAAFLYLPKTCQTCWGHKAVDARVNSELFCLV